MPTIYYPWVSAFAFGLAAVASASFSYFFHTLRQAESGNRWGLLLIDGIVLGIGWSGASLLAGLAFSIPGTVDGDQNGWLLSIIPATVCAILALHLTTLPPAFRRTIVAAALLAAGASLTALAGALSSDTAHAWGSAANGMATAALLAFAIMMPAAALLLRRPFTLWRSALVTLLLAIGWLVPSVLLLAYGPVVTNNPTATSPEYMAALVTLDSSAVIGLVVLSRWLIDRTATGYAAEVVELRAANSTLETRLHEAESHAAEHNSALQAVVHKMGETQRFRENLQQLTELLQLCECEAESVQIFVQGGPELFPHWSGALTFADDDGLMTVAAGWGEPFNAQQSTEVDCWAVRRGRLHLASIDPEQHVLSPVCSHFGADGALPPGVKATICAPLLKSLDRPGVLHLVAYEPMNAESMQAAAWRAEVFADALKLSLGNLRLRTSLREQALHDEMTELFNRRHFNETLNRELSRSQRTDEDLILAILDIDHFKNFNDRYGHVAGDEVLKTVAEHLRHFVRAYDTACRVGGEELAIIMPRVHTDEAFTRLNQLREEIGTCVLTYKGMQLPAVTVSIGFAERDIDSPDDLLRRADTAMYAAKNAGRNRVMRWSPELEAALAGSGGKNGGQNSGQNGGQNGDQGGGPAPTDGENSPGTAKSPWQAAPHAPGAGLDGAHYAAMRRSNGADHGGFRDNPNGESPS